MTLFIQSDRHANTRLAFDVAAEHLGIPVRLSSTSLLANTLMPAFVSAIA